MKTATFIPKWVDFHCHLDLYPDHQELIHESDIEGVATLAVTTTPKAFARNMEMAMGFASIRVGLGLHPQLVAERSGELPLFEELLSQAPYVGEVGLDASPRFYASFQDQQRVFERVLRACNEQGNKILSIHSVRATSTVLRALEAHLRNRTCVPVLHWFTGTKSEAARAVELGCYFSINVEMIQEKKMLPLLRWLPSNRLLTETDGPFVKLGYRPIRPSDIPATVELLARLRATDSLELARVITENFQALTSGKPPSPSARQFHLFGAQIL
jgi:TatD DNase family protein